MLNKIADRMEQNLEMLAVAETWDNGKAVRETLNADIPLAIDHFRYFAGAIRAQEGGISQLDVWGGLGVDEVWFWSGERLAIYQRAGATWSAAPPQSLDAANTPVETASAWR